MNNMSLLPTRIVLAAIAVLSLTSSASAEVRPFPKSFRIENVKTNGATIYVRGGGKGPAVIMLHGFGDTGAMWDPLAYPSRGYDKKTQAQDIGRVMDKLNVEKASLVTHDIGNMVGYALVAQYHDRITRWAVIDPPLPGIGPWEELLKNPLLWHFNFRGPDAERLVKGRERIYLDRFWNELSANPKAIGEATRPHYAELNPRPA